MKTVLRIASYLLIFALGLGGGYYFGFRTGQVSALAFDMAEMEYYFTLNEVQMAEGTDATREEALRGFLAFIEKRRGHESPWFTEKIYATDSALANARLSALAKKRGANQEADEYLNRAASFCPQIGWQECSVEKIASVAQRLDKHGLFGSEASE
jgi:hypothetical protein